MLTALALLVVFSMLGTAYVRYMALENERAVRQMRTSQVRHAARAGLRVALAEIEAALNHDLRPVPDAFELKLPVFTADRKVDRGFRRNDRRRLVARVTIIEESTRFNLNHVSPVILEQVLRVPREKARAIKESLPDGKHGADGDPLARPRAAWLVTLDDLESRGFMTAAELDKVDKGMITFSTVADHQRPRAHFNVNTAPEKSISIALGVDRAVARKVVEVRPFENMRQLSAAAGKQPAEFNLPAQAICFEPRSFRVTCEASYANTIEGADAYDAVYGGAEAVAVIDKTGRDLAVVEWHETAGRPAENQQSPLLQGRTQDKRNR